MENFQKKIFLVKAFSLNKNLWQILTYKNKKAFYLFFVVVVFFSFLVLYLRISLVYGRQI